MNKFTLNLSITLSLIVVHIQAQTDYNNVPEVTGVILINDVYIHTNPQDSFGLGDILIENGVIKMIDKEIEAPYNAKIIEGDSTHAYPGLIDAFSNTGIPKPERRNERPNVDFPGFPPNDVAGISPELKASDMIKSQDKSISAMRKEGFALAHAVPFGRMLPGQGAIISLYGDDEEGMILKDQNSILFQLIGARGVYPSTIIAVMAKWRELYKNADLYKLNMMSYSDSALGMKRPTKDDCLNALVPVTSKEVPVFAKASNAKDVYRALALQNEMGYRMVLADVKQASPAISHLNDPDIQLILSLDLPKEEKKSKDKKEGDRKKDDESEVSEEEKLEKKDPRIEALRQRKEESIKDYISQAALLEKEDISFAFSSISTPAKDIRPNLLRMMEAGLSKEKALSALTIDAAKLLGIDEFTGTLEAGKMANIMICDDDYFKKGSSVKYMFIEGQMTEYDIKKKQDSKAAGSADQLLGEWRYTVLVEQQSHSGSIEISKSAEELVVELYDDNMREHAIVGEDVSFNDGVLNFSITMPVEGGGFTVSLILEMAVESFEGTATISEMGSYPIEGTKVSSPDKK